MNAALEKEIRERNEAREKKPVVSPATYTIATVDIKHLLNEVYILKGMNEKLQDHFDHCNAAVVITLRDELDKLRYDNALLRETIVKLPVEDELTAELERLKPFEDFVLELKRWRPYLHACIEWDGMIIDKGEPEFNCCQCFTKDEEA